MDSQHETASPKASNLQRLVLRLRRRGQVLNAAVCYHFLVHLWLVGWPNTVALYAAALAWLTLPFAASEVWHAAEKLNSEREIADSERRREFFSQNASGVPTGAAAPRSDPP